MKSSSLLWALAVILIPQQAFAYIDPGSGSAIMSAVIGFFVAVGLVVKTYWYKLKSLVCPNKAAKPEQASDEE